MSFWGIFLMLVLRWGWQLSFLRRIQLKWCQPDIQLGDWSKLPQTYCVCFIVSVSCSIMFNSLWPHEACQVPLPMELSRQEYLSGCHFLLQGIFPTQGLNLGLLHCRWILYHLSHIVNISQKHWKLFSVKKENLIPTQLPKATIWFLYFGFFFFFWPCCIAYGNLHSNQGSNPCPWQ